MRVEPHAIGSILHCTQRGVHGVDIVRDTADRERFTRSLFVLNDEFQHDNWLRDTVGLSLFERPSSWPERKMLVRVLAWTLMSNHFHLLLQEISEGGIAKFMQRLCGSMSLSFNKKYGERGTIFQSSYRGASVDSDPQLQYVVFYILVKNVLELYPDGLKTAAKNFDRAWEWALKYRFSSLRTCALKEVSPIVSDDENLLSDLCRDPQKFKAEAKDALKIHMTTRSEEFGHLMLEDW